jgi:hypothetical protein
MPGRDREFSLRHIVQISSEPCHLSNRHWVLFPQGQNGWSMKVTTHLHIVPRLKIRGALSTFPHTSSSMAFTQDNLKVYEAHEIAMLFVCVSPLQFFNHPTDFYVIWYERYAIVIS